MLVGAMAGRRDVISSAVLPNPATNGAGPETESLDDIVPGAIPGLSAASRFNATTVTGWPSAEICAISATRSVTAVTSVWRGSIFSSFSDVWPCTANGRSDADGISGRTVVFSVESTSTSAKLASSATPLACVADEDLTLADCAQAGARNDCIEFIFHPLSCDFRLAGSRASRHHCAPLWHRIRRCVSARAGSRRARLRSAGDPAKSPATSIFFPCR